MKLYLPSDLIEAVKASNKIHANVPRKKQIICTDVIKSKSYPKNESFRTSCLNNLTLVIDLSSSERSSIHCGFQSMSRGFNPRKN